MRRTASQVLRQLEMRVARLEKQARSNITMKIDPRKKHTMDDIVRRIYNALVRGNGVALIEDSQQSLSGLLDKNSDKIRGMLYRLAEINRDRYSEYEDEGDHSAADYVDAYESDMDEIRGSRVTVKETYSSNSVLCWKVELR
jgi:hypothetical protein